MRSERNLWIYVGIAATAFIVDLIISAPFPAYMAWFITFLGAESAEMFNSVSERICDIIDPEYNDEIGTIKDIGSAGVLFWGFAFFGSQAFIIIGTLTGVFA